MFTGSSTWLLVLFITIQFALSRVNRAELSTDSLALWFGVQIFSWIIAIVAVARMCLKSDRFGNELSSLKTQVDELTTEIAHFKDHPTTPTSENA